MQVHALSYDLGERRWSARFPAGDSPRTLVTVFGAPEMAKHPELFIDVARAYPRSLVIGCSSAGEIHATAVRDHSLAVTVTRFDRTDLLLVSADIARVADSESVGAELGQQLAAKPGLRAVLVLCDGLSVNGAVFARSLGAAVGRNVTVTGGLAADGLDFKQTWVTVGGAIRQGVAAAVGFYGPSVVVGTGISSDWLPQAAEWVITRSEGNFVYELDYQPAVDVYRAALSDRADELPDVAIWYPLLVRTGADPAVVRTVIGIDDQEGALVLAGEVKHGQSARLLTADLEDLIEGGRRAASAATKTGAPISVDCLALAVSCFGRRKILGAWSGEELVAMREGLHAQRTTVTGFYAYGQIAPDEGRPAALHNQTLSLTVFSEARAVEVAPARAVRTPPPQASGYTVRSTMFDTRSGAWSEPLPDLDSPRTLVLAFGAPELAENRSAIDALIRQYPTSVIMGCSTAGEIHGAAVHDHSLAVSVTRFARTNLRLVVEPVGGAGGSEEIGRRIARQLGNHAGLRGALVLSEGLHVNGSQLVRGINEVVGGTIPVAGGLAGDGTAFKRTWILAGQQLGPDLVAAVGFYGNHVVVGHGARGGWDRFGMKRTITRSEGNVLFELDGRPALQIYKEYLGERASQLPGSGLSLPLAVRDPVTDVQLVRTLVAVDEQAQSLTFAGDVPTGHLTQFMKADVARLINGATHAALMATENGGPAAAECLVVAISCAGRRHMLGAHTEEEVEAVSDTFRSERVRLTGFYAYGEIISGSDGRCELHNQSMSLLVVSEAIAPVARPTRATPSLAERVEAEVEVVAPHPLPPTPLPSTQVPAALLMPPPAPGPSVSAEGKAEALLAAPVIPQEVPEEPRGPIVRIPRPNVAEIAVEEVGQGAVRVIRIRGRITEAFKGEVAAQLLVGRVILDLGDIHRITSFGVREWIAMFSAATRLTECYLARCSESVVNQLTMIRAFDGGAKILSFFAPYLCQGCNKPFERLFDYELDVAEITSSVPEPVRCPRCNESGRFDDDPRSYFAFFGAHGEPPPAEVSAQHRLLCAQDQVRPAEEVEKIVDGDVTRVRVTGRLSLNIRWRRVFENIDGGIIVDLSSVTAVEPSGLQGLDFHLRTMTTKQAVGVEHAPMALLERLVQRPAPEIAIFSVTVPAYCTTCTVARTTTVKIDQYLADPARATSALCKRCDQRLQLQLDPVFEAYLVQLRPAVVAVQEPPPLPAPVVTGEPSAPPLASRPDARTALMRYRSRLIAGVLILGALIGWQLTRASTKPRPVITVGSGSAVIPTDAGVTGQKPDDLPPSWADRPFTVDRNVVYLVGESQETSIATAIASARGAATAALIRQLLAELVTSRAHAFIASRVGDGRVTSAAVARFTAQYGTLASFERIDAVTQQTRSGPRVFVRFKLPKQSYDRILAAYREVDVFRGMTVAQVFPMLADGIVTKGNLVVVAVQDKSTAAVAKVREGDVLLRVGDTAVTTIAAFRAARKLAWKQPDVRAKLTIEVETNSVTRRAFVGLKRGR